ncbi:peptidoglycan hydrolase-like protein with peptidoglycan-binding domain [Streptomyces africanus]|uniref:Peptidoglycan hydrolase-like protein with peptidoglycan-binding domain n=1 Tax=Streptomyces africanus TaxID=231024 RepID=A0ABU0QUI4_9ACTN|nr:glycoside hydrolase domain-containing protein [Streptomyces africanus]MDQ0751031.1 peptidoglycan hydrolase-like protein with peptidoglycan-binding domain [Streptomyces africanus]
MADEMVRRAQQFINGAYDNGSKLGISRLVENGETSWTVMYALTRALQYELGITGLSDSFGPTTLSTLQTKYPRIGAGTTAPKNLVRVIQSGLYCKGYDGGEIDGTFNKRVQDSMSKLKTDMGVDFAYPGSDIVPKVFKGLLNMDPYVTVNNGSSQIRAVQQWMNGEFVNRKDFFIIPCDGHHSRTVAQAMLYAVQYTIGMADGVANGVFGPGTQAGLKEHTVSVGSSSTWVQLFTAGMLLNHRPVSFGGTFTAAHGEAVRAFQSFVKLPVTGKGDFPTWASLLVSYGDQSRKGTASDGVTRITPDRAKALKAEGITVVGRYLTNPIPGGGKVPEKEIQTGELQTIADQGLRCFPIYQTFGRGAEDFSYPLGRAAGQAAINAALDHGFKPGARIFFAVDFDAYDYEITDSVLPHFKGIEDAIRDDGNRYSVGVYGPRNVCTRVSEAGHASASFVSDMSSGFSGNFGYPLPENWAYDQIVTKTVGSGSGSINIDVNIASGRDTGQGSFNPPRGVKQDTLLHPDVTEAMQTDVGKYMESLGFPLDGGTRSWQHWKCFERTVTAHDELITNLSRRYNMRKALIQTSAYWEMRHITPSDEAAWLAVITAFNTTGKYIRETSTGIAKQRAGTLIGAWNHALDKGYSSEQPRRDVSKDQDKYNAWKQAYDSETYALTSVAIIHLWDIDGKPGGDDDSPALRKPTLGYTDAEIYEVLRRYQGPGEPAMTEAKKRMGLYYVMEKYNSISRNY